MQQESKGLPEINEERSMEIIGEFIKNKKRESKTDGVVIGLSGGLDSSTIAHICARFFKKNRILGLVMPSHTTSIEDVDDAVSVADKLDIEYEIIPIDGLIEPFTNICHHYGNEKIANANLKARMRMTILYYHSNIMNRLVVGTGNRSELLVGYFTKYGDGGVDILPIGDLYKTQVIQLASYLGVPENIIKKVPTAGLWAGQTDEEELGIKYQLLDQILYFLVDKKFDEMKVASTLEIPPKEVSRIKRMIKSSKHKLLSPSIAKVR